MLPGEFHITTDVFALQWQSRAVLIADRQRCGLPAFAAGQRSLRAHILSPPACSCAASSQSLSCKARAACITLVLAWQDASCNASATSVDSCVAGKTQSQSNADA